MFLRNRLKLLYLLFSVPFLGLLILLYFSVFPLQVIKVSTQPYPVVSKQINAGDDLVIRVDYCKYVESEVEYYVQFYGIDNKEVVTSTPQSLSDLFVGCRTVDFHWPTPESLTTGTYFAVSQARYRLTPFQRLFYQTKYVTQTEEFQVNKTETVKDIIKEISTIINNYYVVDEKIEEGSNSQE